jgi:Terminase large subunit, T4likevirus-type, N-terminal
MTGHPTIHKRKHRIPVLPSQSRFLECGARSKGFSGPVGAGKTHALCCQALRSAAENPGCTGLLGAPTYPMLKDATLPTLLDLLGEYAIAHKYEKSENVLTLIHSRSRILLRSLDRYEHLRGTNLAWVGIDELTYCNKEAWQRLEARVRDPAAGKHQMFAVWTPKGYDWVYKRFISLKEKLPAHEAIIALPDENHVVLSKRPDYYEHMKSSYDPLFYRQEALGEYLNTQSGRVYHGWSEANEEGALRYVPAEGLCWALDFNVDPMAAVIAQFLKGRVHVLKELFLRNSDTISMCERFEQAAQPFADAYRAANGTALPVTVYGDATGDARSTSSKTDYDLIGEYFRNRSQFKMRFDYPRSNPPVRDRVNSVNAMLKNASGDIRTRVHPDCKELITDFLEVGWKQGALNFELDKVSDKARTHLSDALGYMIWRVAPINGFQRVLTPK